MTRAWASSLGSGILLLLLTAVGGCGAAMATPATQADVAGCQALGDVDVQKPTPTATDDQELDALRAKAAQEGATHVVAAKGSLNGKMYKCETEHSPSRSEQRMGL